MDIKKLTQEVLLNNMTPEQQMAVLDSVTASVKEAKAVQKQKIAENVDLVLQALKRIESDMLKRVEGTAEVVEARVKTIKDGKDGKNGLDGKNGKDGLNGKDGKDGRDGRDGLNGKSGERGQDGTGVQSAHIDFDGSLIISLTDGQELNVGEVVPFDVAEKIRVIGNGGGTSQFVLDTLADLQAQINIIGGGLVYKETWNASTNTPSLTSSIGTNGWYYVVNVAGSTNLNGITDWQVGDWAIFNGTFWQKIDQTNSVISVNGQTGVVTIGAVPTGGTAGQVLAKIDSTDYNSQWIDNYATQVKLLVKNATGSTITKGSVVYVSGATGANALISLAKADADSTSATTVGILESTLTTGSSGYAVTIGTITGIDTSTATEGDPVWLSGTTAGAKVYGIANKPNAPTHIVYLGTVTRAHAVNGEIQVMINNGWELDELHNVSALSPSNGQTIVYNSSTSLWEKNTVSLAAGVNGVLPIANGGTNATTASAALTSLGAYPAANPSGYTSNTGTVTSVSGTGTVNGLTLTGTVTTSGSLTFGGTLDLLSSAIGATAANTGKFSNLEYTGTLTGSTGIVNLGSGQFYKDASGNLGVGTSSSGKLDIAGSGGNFRVGGAGDSISFTKAGTNYISTTTAGGQLLFQTGAASNAAIIDSSGNVGIGSTSPAQALHVARGSAIAAFSTFRANGSASGALYGQDASNNAYCWNESNAPLLFGTNQSERMRIDATGVITAGAGNVLLVSGTSVASTSGTSINFTGIPSWAKRITVMFNGVSTNSTSPVQIQIGSGSVLTTGYFSKAGNIQGTSVGTGSSSTGFLECNDSNASFLRNGVMTLTLLNNNSWSYQSIMGCDNAGNNRVHWAGGSVSLSGALDRVRITTVNGTDTFDAGSINILYE